MLITYLINILFKYFHIYIWNRFKNILRKKNIFKNKQKYPNLDENKKCLDEDEKFSNIDEYKIWINDNNDDEWFPN